MFFVDIPTEKTLDPDGSWKNVAQFQTKADAVRWIRETIGPCDDEGNICLITHCPQGDEVAEEGEAP